jgi:bla regulator protein blaR1
VMIMPFWNREWTAALVNHLWQSTVIILIAWQLSLALKKNRARVRFWVWLTASLKFLLPFSLLIRAGVWLRPLIPAPAPGPAVANVVEEATQLFSEGEFPGAIPAQATDHHANWLLLILLAVWTCGVLIVAVRFGCGWWRVYAARRAARPIDLAAEVPVLATSVSMEPGIFGIFRPVLLLPDGILERLTSEEMRAIVAHEMCHVRRRDNLTFAMHMIVEALFWFYPPVWWIGARLIDERERACDETVLEAGGAAHIYAEGILNVCKFYVESPLACAAGVTGADLKKRIARIMTRQISQRLSVGGRLLIGVAGLTALGIPLSLGLVRAAQSTAQAQTEGPELPKYEIASIKPHQDDGMRMQSGMRMTPDGVSIHGMPLAMLVRQALGLSEDRILNEPQWVQSARFDIEAKVAPEDAPRLVSLSLQQREKMMLPLLEERFGLKFYHETRVLPVFSLEVAKGGPKLKETKVEDPGATEAEHQAAGAGGANSAHEPRMGMTESPYGITAGGTNVSLPMLAQLISQQIGSTVVDKTGLTGRYDVSLKFAPDMNSPMVTRAAGGGAPPEGTATLADASGPTIQEALQEQLGLKLVLEKEPVDVVVIDHFERPTAN